MHICIHCTHNPYSGFIHLKGLSYLTHRKSHQCQVLVPQLPPKQALGRERRAVTRVQPPFIHFYGTCLAFFRTPIQMNEQCKYTVRSPSLSGACPGDKWGTSICLIPDSRVSWLPVLCLVQGLEAGVSSFSQYCTVWVGLTEGERSPTGLPQLTFRSSSTFFPLFCWR